MLPESSWHYLDDTVYWSALVAYRQVANFIFASTELAKVLCCFGTHISKQLNLDASSFCSAYAEVHKAHRIASAHCL
eukprot:14969-Heterococcus_DN1.PRE.5